jgi:phosphonate transport system substrate-binding protein
MRFIGRIVILTALVAGMIFVSVPALAAKSGQTPLRIAFIPSENPEQLIDNVRPAVRFLEKRLGRKIKYFITLSYSSAVEALNAEKADISFMSPLPYILANNQTGAEAILGEIYRGKSYYQSKIFVRRDSGIKSLADLKGKSIAYVDPISSSGFMYPHDIFIRTGLAKGGLANPEGGFFRRVYFAGGDEQAIRAVFGGFVDAAGVSEYSINLLKQKERDELVPLATSVRIPSHGVVVRKGLPPEVRRRFVEAMLELNKPANRKYLRYLYGTEGYIQVNHQTYKSVADMARKYGFLKR